MTAAFGKRARSGPGPRYWTYARKRGVFLGLLAAPALIYVLAIAVGPLIQGFLYSFES